MMRCPLSEFKKQDAHVKSQALSREIVFFLALILSACIITNSLIHEILTLMKRLFKLLRAPFIGSNCLLD
jgi:hypothetical protein